MTTDREYAEALRNHQGADDFVWLAAIKRAIEALGITNSSALPKTKLNGYEPPSLRRKTSRRWWRSGLPPSLNANGYGAELPS